MLMQQMKMEVMMLLETTHQHLDTIKKHLMVIQQQLVMQLYQLRDFLEYLIMTQLTQTTRDIIKYSYQETIGIVFHSGHLMLVMV